jgi:Fe-S cluster assembly iron-binding protein IscA
MFRSNLARFASLATQSTKPTLKRTLNIINLTPSAVSRLTELMKENGEYLKVGTKKKGCSGNAYTLDYVSSISKLDEIVKQDGVTVVVYAFIFSNA